MLSADAAPKKNKGFTLIELLVVMAIISLLSSIVITTLGSARSKANDARRASDAKELQKALELYYADNGQYPVVSAAGGINPYKVTSCTAAWDTEPQSLINPYLKRIPSDPKGCSSGRRYTYIANRNDYKIEVISPENPQRPPSEAWFDPSKDNDASNCTVTNPSSVTGWAVWTPGGLCWY